jgi:hypothetical protein
MHWIDLLVPVNQPLEERNAAIVRAYQVGETLDRLATNFGLSIARVHQTITKQ